MDRISRNFRLTVEAVEALNRLKDDKHITKDYLVSEAIIKLERKRSAKSETRVNNAD